MVWDRWSNSNRGVLMKEGMMVFGLLMLLGATDAVAQLVCTDPVFDFGTRREGEEVVHSFMLKNQAAKTFTIMSIDSGCGCLTGFASKYHIEPGEEVEINVRFDLTHRSGPQDREIYIYTKDSNVKHTTLRLTGKSIIRTLVKPRILVFRNVSAGVEHSSSVLLYGAEEDLAPGTPQCTSRLLTCSIQPGSKKGEYILTAVLSKAMPVGKSTARINLPIYADSETLSIPIYIAVQNEPQPLEAR